MVRTEDDARKHPARDRGRLRACLRQRDEPLTAKPLQACRGKRRIQQHVRQDVQRGAEPGSRGDEADRSALASDGRRHRRAEELQRVRQRLAIASFRSFAQKRRGQRGDALPPCGLELVIATKERDRKGNERQIVLLGHDQVRTVGERALAPGWYAEHGCRARRRYLFAIESLLGRRGDREAQRCGESDAAPHLPPPGFFSSYSVTRVL